MSTHCSCYSRWFIGADVAEAVATCVATTARNPMHRAVLPRTRRMVGILSKTEGRVPNRPRFQPLAFTPRFHFNSCPAYWKMARSWVLRAVLRVGESV